MNSQLSLVFSAPPEAAQARNSGPCVVMFPVAAQHGHARRDALDVMSRPVAKRAWYLKRRTDDFRARAYAAGFSIAEVERAGAIYHQKLLQEVHRLQVLAYLFPDEASA